VLEEGTPRLAEFYDKTPISAVAHNDMDAMLDSESTAPSPQFGSGSATKVKMQRLKEHRRVQAEHELMRKHADYFQQEAALLEDKACWNSTGWVATRAALVVQLARSVRHHWLSPGDGVHAAAESAANQPGGSLPPCSAKSIRNLRVDWRQHGFIGFTEDQRGRNHRHTMLRDAHPAFEDDVRTYIEGNLTSKEGKMSVAIIPRHDGCPSELRDLSTFPSKVPCTSHAVAWRCVVQLGFKCGSLKKGRGLF
jgi:hypothetical protein